MRAPRGPKLAPRRLQEGPRWPQGGSKRAQAGPKMAPRGPKMANLAQRALPDAPGTLPDPSGERFRDPFCPENGPPEAKIVEKTVFSSGCFCDTGVSSLGLSSDRWHGRMTSKIIVSERIIERKLATSTTGGWRRRRKQSPQPEPACCGTKTPQHYANPH